MTYIYNIGIDIENPDGDERYSVKIAFEDERRCMTMDEFHDRLSRFMDLGWVGDYNESPFSEGHILALDEVVEDE